MSEPDSIERPPSATNGHAAQILAEMEKIIASAAFSGSRRSQQFFRYVVENAVAGDFDKLKERVIGNVLFQRTHDYDTGSDAIVRVVAHETRKRLDQHWLHEPDTALQIRLPSGSYVPIWEIAEPAKTGPLNRPAVPAPRATWRRYAAPALAVLVSCLCLLLLVQNRELRKAAAPPPRPPEVASFLPWSALFETDRGVHLILGDTSVGGIQRLLRSRISLSDYLNRRFVPASGRLSPETRSNVDYLLSQQFTSASYAAVAAKVAHLAGRCSRVVRVSYAREISLRTLQGGDHFILLGTPRANPWTQLFENRLNFVMEYSQDSDTPLFRNRSPLPGEASEYNHLSSPAEAGKSSYGYVAFLPNVYQSGHALLVSGTNSPSTEAVAELITNPDRLRAAMQQIGLDPNGPPRHFEILLEAKQAAGVPVEVRIAASRVSAAR